MSNVQGAKYAVICDFEVLGYFTTIEDGQAYIDAEKKRLDFLTIVKKKLVRKILKGSMKLPSEDKHFYIAEVIA